MNVPTVEDVVNAIERAFAGVPRGAGITLHEADAIDKKLSDAERAQLRNLDTETRWQDVPAELIARFSCQLALVDGEGYRYYIPAFMRWVVTHYCASRSFTIDSTIYGLGHVANPGDYAVVRALPLLSAAQRCAIAQFLLHMSTAAALHADAAHAQQALDRFWGRYDD
jgi:hypothetical protein